MRSTYQTGQLAFVLASLGLAFAPACSTGEEPGDGSNGVDDGSSVIGGGGIVGDGDLGVGGAVAGNGGTTTVFGDGGAAGDGVGGGTIASGGAVGDGDAASSGGEAGDGDASTGGAAGDGDGDEGTPVDSLSGAVQLSVSSRTFEGQLVVGMTGGSEIRYTTDGSLPTSSSPVYDGTALTLTETTQLRAAVFNAGAMEGAVSTGLYIRRTFDVSADVPIVIMEGYGGGKPPSNDKNTWFDLGVMMFEPTAGGSTSISELPTLATRAGYHRRGQSSSNFPKTPYRVEFWNAEDSDVDLPTLGMPKESDWAFVGPCTDRTLVRNAFVYSLGADMGLMAMQLRFAEVYINQDGGPLEETDYEGVYAITQSVKNQKSRVNLKQLKPEDVSLPEITGGYIFKFDQAAVDEGEIEIPCDGSPGCWDDLELVDPSPPNDEQLAWIAGHIQEFHNLLMSDPIGEYQPMMNVQSFVDHFLINEMTRDVDAYIRSHFMHKDRDGLITAGPIWDYNFSLGNISTDLEGWQYEEGRKGTNEWHRVLGADPLFHGQMASRYQELRSGILSDIELFARLDMITAPLINAATHDLARWPVGECSFGFGGGMFPGGGGGGQTGPTSTDPLTAWQDELNNLKTWISDRMAWLDSQFL